MKGRIILYGWVLSLVFMMGGLGAMEWAMETGVLIFLKGLLTFLIFVVFSLLVIYNPKDADKAVKEFDRWVTRAFGGKG